jgi:hypothetical protein
MEGEANLAAHMNARKLFGTMLIGTLEKAKRQLETDATVI